MCRTVHCQSEKPEEQQWLRPEAVLNCHGVSEEFGQETHQVAEGHVHEDQVRGMNA